MYLDVDKDGHPADQSSQDEDYRCFHLWKLAEQWIGYNG